jgi:hypothetical protein
MFVIMILCKSRDSTGKEHGFLFIEATNIHSVLRGGKDCICSSSIDSGNLLYRDCTLKLNMLRYSIQIYEKII